MLGLGRGWRERRAARRRAMYPGGRPDAAARAVHRRFVAGPVPRVVPTAAVLEVRGRRSGSLVRVPLAIAPYRWQWYLVSMFGEQANWVANVRAAGGEVMLVHGRRRAVRLVEIPVAERAPVIRRYLLFAWGARPHMPITWRSSLSDIAAVAAAYPVFRVVPRR